MTKEKGIDISLSAVGLYDRASSAIDEMDYDYAIKLLRTSLSINPNFPKSRALLVVAQAKKLRASNPLRRQIKRITLMIEAFFFESIKKWDRALEKYEYLLSIFPPQVPILTRLGNIYLQKGMAGKAIEVYQMTLKLQQDNIYALLRLTKLLREKGKIKEAEQHCQRYLKVKPNDFTVTQELQNLETLVVIDKEGWEDKSSFVEKTASLQPKRIKDKIANETTSKIDIDSTLLAAKTFFNQNRYDDAINEYKKVVAADPHNMQAHQALGELYVRGRWFDKAIEEYEKFLALDPEKRAVLDTLANLYIRKGDTAAAIEKYEKITLLSPEEPRTYRLLGDIYLKGGNTKKALENYQLVARLDPEHPAIHIILGEIYIKSGEPTKAIEEYKKQIALEPTNSTLIEQLGDLYLKKGKLMQAKESYLKATKLEPTKESLVKKIKEIELVKSDALIRHYELSLKSNPENKELYKKLIDARQNKFKIRVVNAKERIKKSPDDISLRLELGKLYSEGGMLNEALVEFQACLNESLLRQESLYSIGAVFEKKGMLDMAANRLKEALAAGTGLVDEQTKNILYKLGNISEATADKEKALSFYKKIYETDITYKDVAKKVESGYL